MHATLEVQITGPELICIEMIRVALSEESMVDRTRAIENVKYDVQASLIEMLFGLVRHVDIEDPRYIDSLAHVARTSRRRHDAAYELAQTSQKYEAKNERKLNVAEQIGKLVCLSILDGKFAGLHTEVGILQQVQNDARRYDISGAKDKDVLRKIWSTYRGVVHLGMAMDYCEDNSLDNINVLQLAEDYRRVLSEHSPKGTSKPYVSVGEQKKFRYVTVLRPPRS